jgi:PKHD-type hydroxylase
MLGDWQVWTSAFSKEACEDIINKCHGLQIEQARIGSGVSNDNFNNPSDSLVDFDIRRTRVAWVPEQGFSELYFFINSFSKKINRDCFGFDISHGVHEVQFASYDSKQLGHYDWHQDVFFKSSKAYDRKLTLILQLSDPETYEGGEFEFRGCDHMDPALFKPQGSVLVFPAFTHHRITNVTEGMRYSITAWIEGPKWK